MPAILGRYFLQAVAAVAAEFVKSSQALRSGSFFCSELHLRADIQQCACSGLRIQVQLICSIIENRAPIALHLQRVLGCRQSALSCPSPRRGLRGWEVAPERVRLILEQSLVATVARRLAAGFRSRVMSESYQRNEAKWLIKDVSAVEANT